MFKRKPTIREKYIADVVEAWNKLPNRDKPDLMLKHSELYFAVAWLTSYETVTKEKRRGRMPR
jgi:hypothetical protein